MCSVKWSVVYSVQCEVECKVKSERCRVKSMKYSVECKEENTFEVAPPLLLSTVMVRHIWLTHSTLHCTALHCTALHCTALLDHLICWLTDCACRPVLPPGSTRMCPRPSSSKWKFPTKYQFTNLCKSPNIQHKKCDL